MNHKGTITSYIIGFILSLVLTFAAFIPVFLHQTSHHLSFSHELLLPLIIGLAFIQLVVQLVFFLHLGRESKPYFNLIFLFVTAGMIFIVVVGSLWIMTHLNYNMSPEKMNTYLMKDEGYRK
jgi:cytochrome o ubiquinol oxidase operon protein cyoD